MFLKPATHPLGEITNLGSVINGKVTIQGYEPIDPVAHSDPTARLIAQFLKDHVPVRDPRFIFHKDLVRDFNIWWSYGDDEAFCLWGPTGAGKTEFITQMMGALNVPLFELNGSRRTDDTKAFGHYVPSSSGAFDFVPGPLYNAATYGAVLLINEFDRLRPEVAVSFNDAFRRKRPVSVPTKPGTTITPTNGYRVAVTANTNLVEDPSGHYHTSSTHDPSVPERFFSVHCPYVGPEVDRAIIRNSLLPFDNKLLSYWFDQEGITVSTEKHGPKSGAAITRDEFIEAMLSVASSIRMSSRDGGNSTDSALERTMSPRVLARWAKYAVLYSGVAIQLRKSALHMALQRVLSGMATESTSIALHEAVVKVFGVPRDLPDSPIPLA